MPLTTARLYLATVRHLTLRQVLWRVRYAMRRRLRGFVAPPLPAEAPPFETACLDRLHPLLARWAELAPPAPARVEGPRAGIFTFAGETVKTGAGPPWQDTAPSRLWQYELHGCAFLRDLALAELVRHDPANAALALDWMRGWVAANPPGPGPAWEAYPTAARLMNWALAEAVFRLDDETVRLSYRQQAAHLADNIEWHLGGNHVVQNLAGLGVARALLGLPEEEEARGATRRETARQVLPDGGHVERCPMYHARVVLDLLLLRTAAPGWVRPGRLRAMARFLLDILHEDGDIPQFGDSALAQYPPPRALADLVEPGLKARGGSYSLTDSGLHVLQSPAHPFRVVMKTSGIPGNPQPGHAHSDALSFEATFHGERLFVDSGVHGYEGSPLRDYCRATAAHNTVLVDGLEQFRFWKTFRVAARAETFSDTVSEAEDGTVELLLAGVDLTGSCTVYRSLSLPPAGNSDGLIMEVTDEVAPGGRAVGCVRSLLHVHPDWSVERGEGMVLLRKGDRVLEVRATDPAHGWSVHRGPDAFDWSARWRGAGRFRRDEGGAPPSWYCPQFGQALPTWVLVLDAGMVQGDRLVTLGYSVVDPGRDPA